MDLNEIRKRFSPPKPQFSAAIDTSSSAQVSRPMISFSFIAANVTKTFAVLLIVLPVLVTFSVIYHNPHSDHRISSPFVEARVLDPKSSVVTWQSFGMIFIFFFSIIIVAFNDWIMCFLV